MSKFTLTVNTDSIEELLQLLTPSIVASVQKKIGIPTEPPKVETEQNASVNEAEAAEVADEPAEKPVEKRGRKKKAEAKETKPEAADDFSDIVEEEAEEEPITRQKLADTATAVGMKLGRDTMIACIKKHSASEKLAGVEQGSYNALMKLFNAVLAFDDKTKAAAYIASVK